MIISLPMMIINKIIKESFGGADVILVALCGFLMGYEKIIIGTMIGILVAGCRAFFLLIKDAENRYQHLPFIPYLSFGIFLSYLYSDMIIKFYFQFFMLGVALFH